MFLDPSGFGFGSGVCLAFGVAGALGILAGTAADGDVSERAAFGPVTAAVLAVMARLGEVVIVVIAEFGVGGFTAGALELLVLRKLRRHLIKHCWVQHL